VIELHDSLTRDRIPPVYDWPYNLLREIRRIFPIRTCSKCSKTKPETPEFFYWHPTRHRFEASCKICTSAREKVYNRESYHVRRAYELSDKGKATASRKNAKFRNAHPDRTKAAQKAWRDENQEVNSQRLKDWRAENPAKVRRYCRQRYAIKKQAMPSWAKQGYIDLFYKLAVIEAARIGAAVEVDHIVPLQSDLVCGLHCEDNLQLLTRKVNMSKGNRLNEVPSYAN